MKPLARGAGEGGARRSRDGRVRVVGSAPTSRRIVLILSIYLRNLGACQRGFPHPPIAAQWAPPSPAQERARGFSSAPKQTSKKRLFYVNVMFGHVLGAGGWPACAFAQLSRRPTVRLKTK